MTAKLQPNRVRRTYLGGGRIDAFCGVSADVSDGVPRPEDWLASTTQAFNGTLEIKGEGLGRLEDGRLVKDVAGGMPILVKLLDSDERLVVQAHPTVPCAKRLFDSPVGKTECWYFLPGTAPDAEMRNLSDRKIAVVGKPGGASVNKERNQTVKDGESGRKTVSCRRFNPVPASMEGGSR